MVLRRAILLSVCCMAVLLVGCGDEGSGNAPMSYASDATAEAYYLAEVEADGVAYETTASKQAEPDISRPTTPASRQTIERKIIYNATINMNVDDFEGVEAKVAAIVDKHDGFIASSNVSGHAGSPRYGQFTVRVPSSNFDAFMEGAQTLGDVTQISTDSQEVTAEFVDLQSRIRNKQKQEERLVTLLQEETGMLEDILKVENELARVRGEVEQMQGRLRVLSDLTSLATVTLNVQEIKDYVPAEAEAPGFGTRIARAFGGSIDGMVDFFQACVVALAAMLPWLIVLAIPVVLIWRWVARKLRRRKQAVAA